MGTVNQVIPGDSGISDLSEQQPLLDTSHDRVPHTFPDAKFTRALTLRNGVRVPQTIAHRGYKAIYPENSMLSHRKAVEAGTHALETDIHLTKDGIPILSHDPTLKRCFGRQEKIIDLEWSEISKLRTTSEPHEPMARLDEFLEYIAKPEQAHLWILLDIKLNNVADDVMRIIGETIKKVEPAKGRPWHDRVVLGVWATNYVPLCEQYLPGFPVSHIGFSAYYARSFHAIPNVSFNMLNGSLLGPVGGWFVRKSKKLNRPIYAWTVNEEKMMRWGIQNQLDGVITDDPKMFLAISENWKESSPAPKLSLKDIWGIIRVQILVSVFYFYFRFRVGQKVDPRYKRRVKV